MSSQVIAAVRADASTLILEQSTALLPSTSVTPAIVGTKMNAPPSVSTAGFARLTRRQQLAYVNGDDALSLFVSRYYLTRGCADPDRLDLELSVINVAELRDMARCIGVPPTTGQGCGERLRAAIKAATLEYVRRCPQVVPRTDGGDQDLKVEEDEGEELADEADEVRSEVGSDTEDLKETTSARIRPHRKVRQQPTAAAPSESVLAALGRLPGKRSTKSKSSKKLTQTAKSKHGSAKAFATGVTPKPKGKQAKKQKASRVKRDSSEDDEEESGSSSTSSDSSNSSSSSSSSSDNNSSTEDSSDSASSDDELTYPLNSRTHSRRQREKLKRELSKQGFFDPMAREFIKNALSTSGGHGTILNIYTNKREIKKARNQYEIYALARIIDALREEKIHLALELAVRRLAGTEAADETDSWDYCNELMQDLSKKSFVPARHTKQALKNVLQHQALTKLGETKGVKPKGGAGKDGSRKPNTNRSWNTKGSEESTQHKGGSTESNKKPQSSSHKK